MSSHHLLVLPLLKLVIVVLEGFLWPDVVRPCLSDLVPRPRPLVGGLVGRISFQLLDSDL
jgi:hypothetical protein